jgi:hypothetical protein
MLQVKDKKLTIEEAEAEITRRTAALQATVVASTAHPPEELASSSPHGASTKPPARPLSPPHRSESTGSRHVDLTGRKPSTGSASSPPKTPASATATTASATLSNDERLAILLKVKSGLCTVDEATSEIAAREAALQALQESTDTDAVSEPIVTAATTSTSPTTTPTTTTTTTTTTAAAAVVVVTVAKPTPRPRKADPVATVSPATPSPVCLS